jgi:hypothetical protein
VRTVLRAVVIVVSELSVAGMKKREKRGKRKAQSTWNDRSCQFSNICSWSIDCMEVNIYSPNCLDGAEGKVGTLCKNENNLPP